MGSTLGNLPKLSYSSWNALDVVSERDERSSFEKSSRLELAEATNFNFQTTRAPHEQITVKEPLNRLLNIKSSEIDQANASNTSPMGFFELTELQSLASANNGVFKHRNRSLDHSSAQNLAVIDTDSKSQLLGRKQSHQVTSTLGAKATHKQSVRDFFSSHQRFNSLYRTHQEDLTIRKT